MCSKSFLSRSVLRVICRYWATIPQASPIFLEVRSERLLGENKSGRNQKMYMQPQDLRLGQGQLVFLINASLRGRCLDVVQVELLREGLSETCKAEHGSTQISTEQAEVSTGLGNG